MMIVEQLTLRVWLFVVWPRLVWGRLARENLPRVCYFIDARPLAIRTARLLARMVGVVIEKLVFRLVDIRDESGLLLRIRTAYHDLAEVQTDAISEPSFQEFLASCGKANRLALYVIRSVASVDIAERATLWRALLLVHVARWKARAANAANPPLLILDRRPWSRVIRRYAVRHNVFVIDVLPAIRPRDLLQRLFSPRGIGIVRAIRDRVVHWWLVGFQKGGAERRSDPQLAVSYLGQFNLSDPARYSDLFFWQESELDGRDILVLFEFRQDPLDRDKWRQLRGQGIGAVALYPGATSVPEVPLYTYLPIRSEVPRAPGGRAGGRSGLERRWLSETVGSYSALREYWRALFTRQNVKVYVTWNRYNAKHIAIADALRDVGGVMAIYQRACQPDAGPQITVGADVMFGYAPADADVERRSGSVIPYHVAVGYFGDHRFPLLRDEAATVRLALRARGAEYIIAYLDENSADDSRWHTGHEFMRDNYAFVLEQLLADPSLGLVLKPKFPSTLRRRLGPVAPALERALASGRCYMFDEGPLHSSHPPAVAALAADIAVHGHLCAGSAGFEAALAGIPTLLLDREGWHVSEMFRLGEGRVVFREWRELWRALLEHRARPGGIPGFGDWSPMMDELDPFRDGHAAERVGTYLQWLLEGFKAGLDRDAVLADAAERYCRRWGSDKITAVRGSFGHTETEAPSSPRLPRSGTGDRAWQTAGSRRGVRADV